MKRLRIYIDTSVIGGCLDEEFAEPSRALLDMARHGEAVLLVSDVLADELVEAPRSVQEVFDALPDESLERIAAADQEQALQQQYLEAGVVTEKAENDALHVAIATVAHADMIVSWNFKHIVNFQRMRGYNAVNLREGYSPIEIHSPWEVIGHEEP